MNLNKVSSAVLRMKRSQQQAEKENQLTYLSTVDILPSNLNQHIYEDFIESSEFKLLRESIKQEGILQPLLVVPHIVHYNKFEIVAGHRRHKAAQLEGLKTVPCIIANRDNVDDIDLQISLITTNLLVRERTPAERAKEIELLEPLLKEKKWGSGDEFKGISTRKMLSEATGLSERTIADYQDINKNLDEENKKAFEKGEINLAEAKEITQEKRKKRELESVADDVNEAFTSQIDFSEEFEKENVISHAKNEINNLLDEIIKTLETNRENGTYILNASSLNVIRDLKHIVERSDLFE